MVNYSWRILTLSIVISLITAFLVYAALQLAMVRPLRRITDEHHRVPRAGPRTRSAALPPSTRSDEIGLVQTELSRMQEGLRTALAQKTRLAALGSAVGKINHDLRNLLANAMLLSDRLEQSQDPEVRHVAPRLVEAMDRAARLCAETLSTSRAPRWCARSKTRFALAPLLDEVGLSLLAAGPDRHPLAQRGRAPRSCCTPTATSCSGCWSTSAATPLQALARGRRADLDRRLAGGRGDRDRARRYRQGHPDRGAGPSVRGVLPARRGRAAPASACRSRARSCAPMAATSSSCRPAPTAPCSA